MAIEIERKFLVTSNEFMNEAKKNEIHQAYLLASDKMAIRIRIDEFSTFFKSC